MADNAPTSTISANQLNYLNSVVNEVNETKTYINNLIVPTSQDMIAKTNIDNNKYFTIKNILYKSTDSILQGDEIIPNTNCILVDIADVLNNL